KLYGDDLRRPQPKPCHQQDHRVIAPSMFRIDAHRSQNRLYLIRLEVTRQSGLIALGYARHTERQIGWRQAGFEEISKEVAQPHSKFFFVSSGLFSPVKMKKKSVGVGVCNGVDLAGFFQKEIKKKVVAHPPVARDRAFAEASVATEIIFKFAPQICT